LNGQLAIYFLIEKPTNDVFCIAILLIVQEN